MGYEAARWRWAYSVRASRLTSARRRRPSTLRWASPQSAIAILLSAVDVERLKARADQEGIGFTQLARQWILERLGDEDPDEGQEDG